jgi:ribosomal protein L11 methyltransferase
MDNKQWFQATCLSTQTQAQMISDFFQACEALSVTFTNGAEDQSDERFANDPTHDTQLWPQTKITALFDNEQACKDAIETVSNYTPHCPQISFSILEEKNWVHEGQKNFPTKAYGNDKTLWVYPSWDDAYLQLDNKAFMRLDPGLAFGTGTHPTTHLCLEWIANHSMQNKTVFDFGCGSGILSIAALARGAKAVVAIDHDPQAMIASKQNLELNKHIDPKKMSIQTEWPQQTFDIVLANVLANPLITYAEQLQANIYTDGVLVLSGILKEEEPTILAAYADMNHVATHEHEGWLLIELVK